MNKQPTTPIVLLNWNGWEDTIGCLRSLFSSQYEDFCVLIADNNSQDNSIGQIVSWLDFNQRDFLVVKEGELISVIQQGFTYLIQFECNYGFAKGNNKVLESIANSYYEHALLLNNDTEVMPDFLARLIDFNNAYPEYNVLTPLICYYDNKYKIWNAGGKQFWGFRKYLFAGRNIEEVKQKEKIDITFITGCALYFQKSILVNNKLFTEKFFFGEEDFEFSMRMKRAKVTMACVPASIIYHKVSSSISHIPDLKKIYVYYLNRFINIKLNTSTFLFLLWKHLYLFYICYLLRKGGFLNKDIFAFIKRLYKDSKRYNEVNQKLFNEITGT